MGEFKDWKNFWALSDLRPEDTGLSRLVKKGSFRVGGDDQFLEVMPDEEHEGEYIITLQAGNITLTTGSDATFKQGTYIYDKVDPKKRLALTSTGMIAQQDVSVTEGVEDWQNMAEVRTDELGNLVITNADTNDVPNIGVHVNGTIYHFEDTAHPFFEETTGTPTNPQALNGDGTVVQNDENVIIKETSSSKCYKGTITKDIQNFSGTVVFFNKSDKVLLHDYHVFSSGALVPNYNGLMRQTKGSGTVGSYLGLSQTQINNGIFVEE
jgi:hypothetical protein